MHQKKHFQVRTPWIFTKKLNPQQKVYLASRVYLNLKDAKEGEETDFEHEARNLATVLRLILPSATLIALKKCLP